MSSCGVCLETLRDPVSLPCGHIFCDACVTRVVRILQSHSLLHRCPVCSSSYSVVNIDPSLVPVSLRPFITPNIRRLYPSNGKTEPATTPAPRQGLEAEIATLRAENSALKNNTALWRQRAEVHASATLGLLSLVRSTQLHAAKSLKEKTEAESQVLTLKRKAEEIEHINRCATPARECRDCYGATSRMDSPRNSTIHQRPYTPSSISSSDSESDSDCESCYPPSKKARTQSPEPCKRESLSPPQYTSKPSSAPRPTLRIAPWEL